MIQKTTAFEIGDVLCRTIEGAQVIAVKELLSGVLRPDGLEVIAQSIVNLKKEIVTILTMEDDEPKGPKLRKLRKDAGMPRPERRKKKATPEQIPLIA